MSLMYFHVHFMLMFGGGTKHVTQTGATVVNIDGFKIENCSRLMSGPF